MRITAAVLYDVNKPYAVEPVELDPPRRGEVLVKIQAAGVCRSDLHFQRGEATIALPAVLGHEGAGTVERVGEGVSMVRPGDRVILSFVPNCGHCHSCESGRPHLCDEHARTTGRLFDDTSRLHTLAGQDCAHMGKVACFAEYAVVPEMGCVPAPATLAGREKLSSCETALFKRSTSPVISSRSRAYSALTRSSSRITCAIDLMALSGFLTSCATVAAI